MQATYLESIVAFIAEIGLSIREEELPNDTFLPGIRISHGALVFDRGRLKWPGDLLHEAGHLAVTTAVRRSNLDDRLSSAQEESDIGEVESIAWSFAAAVHLSLPLSELFHDGGYGGRGQSLAFTYSMGVYPGAAGLAKLGLTATAYQAAEQGVPPYPRMLRWVLE